MNIALLGAECTGKSTLAAALVAHFNSTHTAESAERSTASAPPRAGHVTEVLRAWCDRMGRTPLAHEQAAIAVLQEHAIQDAKAELGYPAVLVADTTPLMTAIYSLHYFQDASLLPHALSVQRQFEHTLLMGLDLPWQADGIQRDGPVVRQAIDNLLRTTLEQAGVPYRVIYGQGSARLQQAVQALAYPPSATPMLCTSHTSGDIGEIHHCAQCGNAWAERQLFSGLLSRQDSKP